ncbi:hypothetical protein [Subtercola boreus]|nr:hypothetical protein [Subtercola boreus]
MEAISRQKGIRADTATSLCTGTITTTETEPRVATSAEMGAYAEENNLSDAATDELLLAALQGEITYRDWTHSYWGGSLLEKHAGRTFWDGSNAWIATYRGLTGANVCHSEGGIAVGWAVTPLECSSPGAGTNADAYYRFDASVAFEGSPVTLDIGLHYSTNATGDVSTWQVGG